MFILKTVVRILLADDDCRVASIKFGTMPRVIGMAGAAHRTWDVAGKNDRPFSNARIDTDTS